MLDLNKVSKKITTIFNLYNYNGILLKLATNYKNLTWPEFVNLSA